MFKNETAKELYAKVKDLPIIDYHCHISPKMIAEDYKFKNAFELFLGGDHYKWRQLRSNGIDEEYITGSKDDYEKMEKVCINNAISNWKSVISLDSFGT